MDVVGCSNLSTLKIKMDFVKSLSLISNSFDRYGVTIGNELKRINIAYFRFFLARTGSEEMILRGAVRTKKRRLNVLFLSA